MTQTTTVLYLQVGNSGVYWIPERDRDRLQDQVPCACSGPTSRSLPGECGCSTLIRERNERRAIVGLSS